MCSFFGGQISTLGEDLPGRVDGHIELSATEKEDNLQAAACDALSPGSFGFSSPSGPGFVRRHRSGRTFGGAEPNTTSLANLAPSARDMPLRGFGIPAGSLYVDDGNVLSPGSVALASRFTRVPYVPAMVPPCEREYVHVDGERRCSFAISPAADYDRSVLDIIIAGSLRGLHVYEVVEEDRDHCVVRVFRSPPRDEGVFVYYYF
jgi:hypothetical protein